MRNLTSNELPMADLCARLENLPRVHHVSLLLVRDRAFIDLRIGWWAHLRGRGPGVRRAAQVVVDLHRPSRVDVTLEVRP